MTRGGAATIPDQIERERRSIVLPPEVAAAMGMTEEERLQLAAGTVPTFDDLIRELEAEFGTGEGKS